MRLVIFTPLLLLSFAVDIFADVKLFLLPKITVSSEKILTLNDIANIESPNDRNENKSGKNIRDIIIPENIYSDGYIDKREIIFILRSVSDDTLFIYGSAVRVVKLEDDANNIDNGISNNEYVVRKGDRVSITVKKKGISLELTGSAVSDGKPGDNVIVKLNDIMDIRSKIVKGILKSNGIIEVAL